MMTKELEERSKQALVKKDDRLKDSLFSPELAPHYMGLANSLAKSTMVPKQFQGKPQDLFIAMAMGYQLGLSVEQSIQDIAVINGKPGVYGDALLGICLSHPDFEDITETPILKDKSVVGYECTVRRKFMAPTSRPFTLEMAKKAGLLSKPGPWTQYPERMLQMRARAFALRDAFADALKGIKSADEILDYIEDAEYTRGEEKVSSRTELLKQDYLKKTQVPQENSEIEPQYLLTLEDKITTIYNLISEKQMPDERVTKALNYYGVEAINQFDDERANHFISVLEKE